MKESRMLKFGKQHVGDMLKRKEHTMGRMQLWKTLAGSGMNNMLKVNIVALICFIPVMWALLQIITANYAVNSTLPFTSFIGIGYPVVADVMENAFVVSQSVFLTYGVYIIPACLFVSLVLSILPQYAMRNMVWTEGKFEFKRMFKSIKFNTLNGIIISLITSAIVMGMMYLVYLLNNSIFYNGYNVANILWIVGLIAVGLFFAIISMYAFSIAITYKHNIFMVYRDAFLLTVRVFVQNAMIAILTLIPAFMLVLCLNSSAFQIVLMIFMFYGFAVMMLTWTVYSQYVFDLVIENQAKLMKQKNKGKKK